MTFVPLASARSAGRTVRVRRPRGRGARALGRRARRRRRGVRLGGRHDVARVPARRSSQAHGTVCIDNSSAFRMDAACPLSIPEVNPEALAGWPRPGIIAVPNCTTIAAMLAVGPLHRAAGLRRLVLSSYQAVSGAGQKGTRELAEQIEKLQRPGGVARASRPRRAAARRAVRAADRVQRGRARSASSKHDGFTGEEAKMMAEPKKILSAPPTWRCSPRACACRS